MQKHLQRLLILAAMIFAVGSASAQTLADDYAFATGEDTTRWLTLTSPTNMFPGYTDDGASSVADFGFNFTFCGESYHQFSTSSNGVFHLGSTAATSSTTGGQFTSSSFSTSLPKISGIARDMGTGSGGGVFWEVQGTAPNRVLVCEFRLGYTYGSSYTPDVKWQVQLEETTNKVTIVYGPQPSTMPTSWQSGLASASTDIVILDPAAHTASYHDGPVSSTVSSPWHGEGRYYEFTPATVNCAKPVSVTASGVGPDGFTVSWVDTTDATSWIVTLADGTTETVSTEYTNTVTFTGLDANTVYSVSVSGMCQNGDTSLVRSISVRTSCSYLDSLPYTMTFEGVPGGSTSVGSDFAPCWILTSDATDYAYPYVSVTASYNHTPGGNTGVYWYNYNSSMYGSYQIIVAPPVDTTLFPIDNLQFSFWAKPTYSGYTPELRVGVMTNPSDATTFHEIGSIILTNADWEEFVFTTTNYTGYGNYLALRADAGASSWYASVDDITIEEAPACPRIENLHVDSLGIDWAVISWSDARADSWVVEYDTVDFVPGTSAANVDYVADTTYMFNGLESGYRYYVYVHGSCSGDTSVNRMLTFTTLAGLPAELPYSCNFEENGPNGWDLLNANQTNAWYVGNATNNGGNRALYISSDGGATTGYNNTATSYTYAVRTFNISDTGEFGYSYDWKCQGESHYYDFGRVFLVPVSYTWTAGVNPAGSTNAFATWGCPSGWIELTDGMGATPATMATSGSWRTAAGTFRLETPGVYNLVFAWANDGSGGNNPGLCIDNVELVQNTCPTPYDLHATYTSFDTIVMSWMPGGSESSWLLSNGVDTIEVYDTTYTFTDLYPSTSYLFTVRALCDAGDTSMAASGAAQTACAIISHEALPYRYGFEDANGVGQGGSINNCWLTGTNVTYTAYPYPSNTAASGSYSLYMYGYQNSERSWVVLPEFEDTLAILQLKFKLKGEADYSYYGNSVAVGVMTDPTDINSFSQIGMYTATSTTSFDSFTVFLSDYQGAGNRVAIVAQGLNAARYYSYVYLDDIEVSLAPECGNVTDVHVNVGATSAIATWRPSTMGEYAGATIEYREAADSSAAWIAGTTTDTYYPITGLTDGTDYLLRVTNNCSEGSAMPVEVSFRTGGYGCLTPDTTEVVVDTVGNGTATNQYLPSYSFYGNGYSQQIYLASELTGLGRITGMRLNTSAAAQQRPWTIYLAHTSETSVNEWIYPSTMTQVWSGNVNYVSNGWVDFTFDNYFDYNGSDNLLVIVDDHTGSYVSGNYSFTHSLPDGRVSRYMYQDGSAYDPTNPSAGGSGTAVNARCNMIFTGYGCSEHGTCSAAPMAVTEVGSSSAVVAWASSGSETSLDLYYKQASASSWTLVGTVSGSSYTLTGLMPGTAYNVQLVTNCGDETLISTGNFTTECSVISTLPFTENFNSWGSGNGVIPNCWNITGSYSTYPYLYNYYNHSGTGASMYLYNYVYGANFCKFSMPAIDTNVLAANQLQVVFYGSNGTTSYDNGVIVGVMVDPNNWSTFQGVDTIMFAGNPGEWTLYEVPLANYTDTGAYITFAAYTPTSSYTYSYIDDITVEPIPTCPRPDSLMATNATSNSVDLSWHERGGAADWQIEYGPVGFTLGTGTVVDANSNPFTLTGLPASYNGEYYVRSVCSSTDTGFYSRTSCLFSTSQIPATVPYMFDVEDSTEWANWQQNTNNTNVNWVRGTADAYSGTHSFYVSADNGATVSTDMNGVYNVAAWRDIDFGTVDTSFDIKFRAKVGGSMSASYDGLMVFLVDPAVPVVASSANITSPWGSVNDLYRIATARLDTTWHLYSGTFDNISGVHRVAFFWFNQGTGDADFLGTPAAVDDIEIDYASCPRPTDLDVFSVGATSVGLTWNGPAAANYRVAYRVAGASASTNQYVTATTNSVVISGLDTLTSYYFFVRRECSATDNSQYSDGIEVSTSICDGGSIAYSYDMGWTASTSIYAPIGYSYYNYAFTQTLVDSAQLAGMAGDVTAMAFNSVDGMAGDYFTNMDVYLANVPETDLASGFITPDSTHEFVQVTHSANFNYTTGGWHIFSLDTTFTWDGHSNVLVTVNRGHGSYQSGATFRTHNTSNIRTRYLYQDGSAYSVTNPNGGSSGSGMYVGDLQFISCGGASCVAPSITSETHTYESATIAWTGNGFNYEVAIKANDVAEWPAETAVTGNTYTFNGLTPATAYTFRVRQDCTLDEAGYSAWTYGTFVTDSLPCFAPENLVASNVTNATADFSWTVVGEETNWELHVWATGVSDLYVPVTTNPATVSGLIPGVTYSAAVRALCGSALVEGDWSETITFNTMVCPDVTGLTASNVTFNSVDLNWAANSMAQGYVIEYGYRGFNQGQGTTVNVNTNSYQVTGLLDETAYDFYVRAVCATDWTSENWTSVSATTAEMPEDVYTVTLLVNDPTMGTVAGAGSYAAGSTVTISATANAGYHFVNWSDDNTDATRSIVVNSDITLTANFAADQQQGIDEVSGATCTIYPNPATSSTTISVAGVNGQVRISVVDMNGRVVATEMLECAADCVKTMDVNSLAQGAYFVRITGENVNMVKKLVVR